MCGFDYAHSLNTLGALKSWFFATFRPRPSVSEPERRKDMKGGCVQPTIPDRDFDQNLLRRLLGVFDKDVEIQVLVKYTSVEQLVLQFVATPLPICGYQIVVRIRTLWILLEVF